MTDRALDIFKVLEQLDTKNTKFLSELSDKELKSIAPVVLSRWLSGTFSKQQVIIINEIVNPYIFSLYKHQQLLWYLMCISTSGKKQRYSWNKTATREISSNACIQCIKEYFKYNTKQAIATWKVIDHMLILDMADDLGYDQTEINKIRKELGLSKSTTKTTTKAKKSVVDSEYGDFSIGFDF